jgi:hypothetical protein
MEVAKMKRLITPSIAVNTLVSRARPEPEFIQRLINDMPQAGQGVNVHLFRLARCLHPYRDELAIYQLLHGITRNCGRPVSDAEIWRAIRRAAPCSWRPPGAAGLYNSSVAVKAGPKLSPPVFQPALLASYAAKLIGVDDAWIGARSPVSPKTVSPAQFLHHLFNPGEYVVCFDNQKSQGYLWRHSGTEFQGGELDYLTTGKPRGVWFLSQPVNGAMALNSEGKLSQRSTENVTSWRHLLLESDHADRSMWLAALVQMRLPIVSIVDSGGRSVHALLRLNAGTKAEWDGFRDTVIKPALVPLGADPAAMSAVRLTRLPGCRREEKDRWQELLYLNPNPNLTPICEKEAV